LFYLSVRTAYQGIQAGSSHDPHLIVVGSFEALAALLFLVPRTLRLGAAGLLVTFAGVFLLHALRYHFRGDLLIDAVVVLFVAVHGSVPTSWLRPRA
jgi:uncharacterized membrane protein YphA (DoxX/SURF4 family)